MLPSKPAQGVRIPAGANAHAADAAVVVGEGAPRPALAPTKPRMAPRQAPPRRAAVRKDEVAVKAIPRAAAAATPSLVRPVPRTRPTRITSGLGHATAPPASATSVLRGAERPPAFPLAEAEGLRVATFVTNIPASREEAAPPPPGPRRPGLVRPLARKSAARPPSVAVMPPLVALGSRPDFETRDPQRWAY